MTHNKTVLIIDDNEENVNIAENILEFAGYQTLYAYNVDEGLALLKESRPFFVLLDMLIPGKDGFEAIRSIRADPNLKETIVYAYTALASEDNLTKAMQAGCDGVITKPIDIPSFIATVDECFSKNAPPATIVSATD